METNPGAAVVTAVDECLAIAATWLAWDRRPRVSEDGDRIYTPHKAVRRVADHLVDHLAEVEALLAGVPTQPDRWHASLVTFDADWARFSVILVNVWYGMPFFMIMYLASLKSVPDQLYEAAAIDGANWWQRIWYVTLPMMRNIIAITTLFSLIVTFANFDIVRILTAGGPVDQTHLFATWAFKIGIEGRDIPLGASVSLFMAPILAVAAFFILRDVNKRGNEA